MKILVIDTETGGLDPQINGLCSVSMKFFGEDKKLTIFIKPNCNLEYNEQAFRVNNLNLKILEDKGLDELAAVNSIKNFIFDGCESKVMPLGHNFKFDFDFLKELFKRNGFDINDCFSYRYRDSKVVAEALKDAGIIPDEISTSLSKMYEYLCKSEATAAHTSDYDVMMTEAIYTEMLKIVRGDKKL